MNRIDEKNIPDFVPSEVIEDLRNHMFYVFKYMGLGEPTPLQYGMAEALQEGATDMILQAGRGTGKSVITAVLVSWWLLRDPNSTTLVISATAQKSIDFISMVRKIIELVPYCSHLLPNDNDVDNAFMFNVGCRNRIGQDKSVAASGIGSQIVGKHAEYIVGDDVEVRCNCETAEQRNKLMGRIYEFESIRNQGGRVIFLGTPHTQESNYNQLNTQGYECVKFPALFPDSSIDSLCVNVAQWVWDRQRELGVEDNTPTQPERFDTEVLNERMARIGPANFALQFRLDTSLSDEAKYTLKLADIVVCDLDKDMGPDKIVHATSEAHKGIPSFGLAGDMCYKPMFISDSFSPYQQTTMTIDPSGRGSDETGIVIASYLHGFIFIHEMDGIEGGYDDATLLRIAKLAHQYDIKLIRYEENFGDGMFGNLLQPVIAKVCGQVAVEGFRVSTRKEERIMDTLEPVLANHRLVMSPRVIRQEKNQLQLTRITRDRGSLVHDDRIDCLASSVGYFTENMGIDVDKVIAKNEEKAHKEFMDILANDERYVEYIIKTCTSGAAYPTQDSIPKKPTGKLGGRFKSNFGW